MHQMAQLHLRTSNLASPWMGLRAVRKTTTIKSYTANGTAKVCCGIARTSNLDICQPNGLCLNTGKNSFFRDFCTGMENPPIYNVIMIRLLQRYMLKGNFIREDYGL